MREILFRGKQIKDGKWIEGYYCPKPYSHFPCEPTIFPFETINKDWHGERVDPETVCQFTGLTDKNGRKIFEGDLVKVDGVETVFVIVYVDGVFRIAERIRNTNFYSNSVHSCYSEMSVIGNIYDNTELLKGGNDNG